MNLKKHIQARYIKGCLEAKDYPQDIWPQIAFLGRSNVGKSSLINHLTQSKIARTSSTPGKTDLINFIAINETLYFVDLPGYGFAKRGQKTKQSWAESIDRYLHESKSLQLCFVLLDIRHTPTSQDIDMIGWLLHMGKKFHIVWTKCDKLSPSEGKKQLENHLKVLPKTTLHSTMYSIQNPKARLALFDVIETHLGPHGTDH